MRCALGVVFFYHGYPKLAHAEKWTEAFLHMGMPAYFAYIAGVLETCGGALIILGLGTRISAVLLAAEMMVAVMWVDLPSGALIQVDNYQLSLVLAASAFAVAAFGPGPLSADRFLWKGAQPRATSRQ